jgi:predicted Fe-Mo cluster-binding NifX family protein
MAKKILVTLYRDEVAPRFDLCSEVLLVIVDDESREARRQDLVLAHSGADELCDLILDREVAAVITGGIEEEHYHYLRWKRVDVVDAVAGPAEEALARYLDGRLSSGDILFPREADGAGAEEGGHAE